MIDFSQSPSPLFDDIDLLYAASEASEFQVDRLSHCVDACMRVSEFFDCNQQQAVILAWLLRRHFYDEELATLDLIFHIGLRPSSIIHINKLLKEFIEKEWIKPKEDTRYHPFTTYKINDHFIQTVITGDYSHLKPKRIKTVYELLDQVGVLLAARKNNELSYDQLKSKTKKLVHTQRKFELCQFIKNVKMSETELLFFITFCYKHYTGSEAFTIDCVFDEINPQKSEQFFIRQQFKNNKGPLFDMQLIDKAPATHFFMQEVEYRLSDTAIQKFVPLLSASPRQSPIRHLEKKVPIQISEKNLYYEDAVMSQITRVAQLLETENFTAFCQRMKDRGMKAGLTILLYGASGTGKTETVYQLARKSGRTILMVDASVIRSEWVGETEKNVRKVFKEYKKALEEFPECPILLFNEADAIFGRRREATDRVEQMENTLQNILLQELEEFEGIFMATTNLEQNIDHAFDRRILYKMCFAPPSESMRLSIWRDKLPELDEDIRGRINQRFRLTGGQIENIRKKIEVDTLLNIDTEIGYDYLTSLSEQELMMRGENNRRSIGFLQKSEYS